MSTAVVFLSSLVVLTSADEPDTSALRKVDRDFAALVKSMQALQAEYAKSDRKQDKPRAQILKAGLQRIAASRLQEQLAAVAEKPTTERLLNAEDDLYRLLRALLIESESAEVGDFYRAIDRNRVEAEALAKRQVELLRAAQAKDADAKTLLTQQKPIVARLEKVLADLPATQPGFVRSDPHLYEVIRGSPALALADNRKARALLEKNKAADAVKALDSAADTVLDLVGLLEKIAQQRSREQRPQLAARILSHLAAARNEQKAVNEELAALAKAIAGREGQKPAAADTAARSALARRQDRQTAALAVALAAFRGDASTSVYLEVAKMIRRDSQTLHSRLDVGRLDTITLLIGKDVEASLNDMIDAYSKATKMQQISAQSLSSEFPSVTPELCRIIDVLEREQERLERR